ncbi:MAG TPA: hypothetical protein VG096_14595 [Bryobacteraceae bacterium]|jgi:DUF4097 and DUF4098 domain-containing protein YvlB|nr:hypothetical protein [Bryobacteraceae bacterium]
MQINGKAQAFAVLILGAFQASQSFGSTASQQEFRQSYALAAGGSVVIDNPYGDVHIDAWDRGEVRVQAIKCASDSRRLEDAQIVVDSTSDSLSIHTYYGGADVEHPASVHYRITVPRTANLDEVRLVNGGLSIRGLHGAVKATSINGDIRAEQLEGTADLSTVNGQVEANFHRISPAHAISLRSVNGPIVLSIPPGAGAQLLAQNLSGGILTRFGQREIEERGHRFHAILKGGGAEIHLQNVNGGIAIHSTWSRRRERAEL